jgi:MFS family permease
MVKDSVSMQSLDRSRLKSCKAPSLSKSLQGYVSLLKNNRNYRLYLLSHLCQHAGDATVNIATLLSVEHLDPGSGTAVSAVIMCKVIPEIFVTSIGGIIADTYDRRKAMIVLDGLGALAALSFIFAHRSKNVYGLYVAVVLRGFISSLYHPVTTSITPMMVPDPENLKRTNTLSGTVWSLMFIFGGVFGGYLAGSLGVNSCFAFDSVLYILSVILMSKVQGAYNPSEQMTIESIFDIKTKDATNKTIRGLLRSCVNSIWQSAVMTKELVQYLVTCGFGMLIFMKASAALLYGAEDIISVLVTEIEGDDGDSGRRLGYIYSAQGIGCLLGPIFANITIVDGKRPYTMQFACVVAIAIAILGWAGLANTATFEMICFFYFVRSLGTSVMYLTSTLLLQNLANVEMLGRVLSYEKVLSSSCEAGMAFMAGRLQDEGFGARGIANLSASVGGFLLVFWSSYHLFGKGAAKQEFREILHKDDLPYAEKGEIDSVHSPTMI